MGFKQSFLLALKSIATSKMRSFLTMLGLIIGVGSVIILVSLMQGMTNSMTSTFESMGTNLINVNITGRGSSRTIDPEDVFDFTQENSDRFTAVSPTVSLSATLKVGSTSVSTSVTGCSEDYDSIKSLTVENGRFLQYIDIARLKRVCVVGTYITSELFAGENALGQTVKINGNPYTIVGVLEEIGDSTSTSSDNCVYIPYTNASKMSWMRQISSYTFMIDDAAYVQDGMDRIDAFLYDTFEDEDLYSISSVTEMIESLTELTDTMTLLLVGIAGISLLVGGIGIMNIMLVSVTERTREIGIRKSLGAKKRDIMRQFVIEAATTSAVGGVIGIVFGVVCASVVGGLIGLSVSASFSAIAISFGVSLFIGVFFGFLPANKAAKLNPIDALRYD